MSILSNSTKRRIAEGLADQVAGMWKMEKDDQGKIALKSWSSLHGNRDLLAIGDQIGRIMIGAVEEIDRGIAARLDEAYPIDTAPNPS